MKDDNVCIFAAGIPDGLSGKEVNIVGVEPDVSIDLPIEPKLDLVADSR